MHCQVKIKGISVQSSFLRKSTQICLEKTRLAEHYITQDVGLYKTDQNFSREKQRFIARKHLHKDTGTIRIDDYPGVLEPSPVQRPQQVGGVCPPGASLCHCNGPASSYCPIFLSQSCYLVFLSLHNFSLHRTHQGCVGPPNVILSAKSLLLATSQQLLVLIPRENIHGPSCVPPASLLAQLMKISLLWHPCAP